MGDYFRLLEEAAGPLRKVHALEIRLLHPLGPMGDRVRAALEGASRELDVMRNKVGDKLAEGLDRPDMDDEERAVRHYFIGYVGIQSHHRDEIVAHERDCVLWLEGRWKELFELGRLSEAEYHRFEGRWPDGNPKFPRPTTAKSRRSRPSLDRLRKPQGR